MSGAHRPIAVFVCPGRGSYASSELGSLRRMLRPGPVAAALATADAERTRAGQPALAELDAASAFKPSLHQHGLNAAELIYMATMAYSEHAFERYEIAAVIGNSLGWYTALAVAGALDVADGWRLVRTMARLQQDVAGGQILTTTVDDRWRIEPEAQRAVTAALEATCALGDDHYVARSIRLGGHEVLAGTEPGVRHLLRVLPRVKRGEREFPFRLAGHGPFHTRLCEGVAETALRELPALDWRQPRHYLIDGIGDVHSPWSADPRQLLHYTATTQVTETFRFTASVRTALREFNPDLLLCAAPGESLRAPVGHVVIAEGYRGIADRSALFASDLVRTE